MGPAQHREDLLVPQVEQREPPVGQEAEGAGPGLVLAEQWARVQQEPVSQVEAELVPCIQEAPAPVRLTRGPMEALEVLEFKQMFRSAVVVRAILEGLDTMWEASRPINRILLLTVDLEPVVF